MGLVVGVSELYVEVALFTFILANIVYISPMECEVVAEGVLVVDIGEFGVPFIVLLVIRVYMSFREWKVEEGEAEGVSLEKPKAAIATRDMRRIPAEIRNCLDFISTIIAPPALCQKNLDVDNYISISLSFSETNLKNNFK